MAPDLEPALAGPEQPQLDSSALESEGGSSVVGSDWVGPARSERGARDQASNFETVYQRDFDFAWRSLRRLGVPNMQLEDAVQDLFVVVCRRLPEFDGRSQLRTWIFAIAMRVAKEYRRRALRPQVEPHTSMAQPPALPSEQCLRKESVELLDRLLSSLDEDKRVVFILAELEEMSVPEIALAVGANPNTIYSRLRAARRDLNAAISQHRSNVTAPQGDRSKA